LWHVAIPFNTEFKENVKKVALTEEEKLLAVDYLADVFSDVLAQKEVHVVICCPPPNLLQGMIIGRVPQSIIY
jgi:hypothetical protein